MGARVSKINEIILNEYFYRYISKLFIDERIGIGNFLRTIGVKFVVLRGFEHESIGLEIDSI